MEWIHVLVKNSHFTERLEKKGSDRRGWSSLCHVIEESSTVPLFHCKSQWEKKDEKKKNIRQGMLRWTMGAAFRCAGEREKKTKQPHLDKKKKKHKIEGFRNWHRIVLFFVPLLPLVVQQTVSGCRDIMGSAHVRWSASFTQTWCAWQRLQQEDKTEGERSRDDESRLLKKAQETGKAGSSPS